MSDPISTKTPSSAAELLARSWFYHVLAYLFRHPGLSSSGNGRFVEEMDRTWQEALGALGGGETGRLRECIKELRRQIRRTPRAEWTNQYEGCLGHTAHSKAPAYELEYGEEHSHRQPQELADITAFYQAFGLRVSEESHERGDHAAVECEFMHTLLYKQAYAMSRGRDENADVCKEASHRFLSQHLGRWLPTFAFRLSKYAGDGLMKNIADLALSFILWECETQGVEAGTHDFPIRSIQEKEETGCTACQYGPQLGQTARSAS